MNSILKLHLRPLCFVVLTAFIAVSNRVPAADVLIAEGEQFKPLDAKGWKVVHQNDSYASHTYGGAWSTHGGLLGAPATSVDSVATQTLTVATAGQYRVWSKYQAPPYFHYLHQIELRQGGKVVFSHVYGKGGTERLWSFSGQSDELWWPWGVDHDAAEAPKSLVQLAAGPVEVRLTAVANGQPAGDRFIDFVVLTTNPADEYQGFKPFGVGSPFTLEALAATRLYARFQNTSNAAANCRSVAPGITSRTTAARTPNSPTPRSHRASGVRGSTSGRSAGWSTTKG